MTWILRVHLYFLPGWGSTMTHFFHFGKEWAIQWLSGERPFDYIGALGCLSASFCRTDTFYLFQKLSCRVSTYIAELIRRVRGGESVGSARHILACTPEETRRVCFLILSALPELTAFLASPTWDTSAAGVMYTSDRMVAMY